MILLEYQNSIAFETLKQLFTSPKRESVNVTAADFDGVLFHIFTTAGNNNEVTVSLQTRCAEQLNTHGAKEILAKEYGNLVTSPEPGYDFSLKINLDALPGEAVELARKLSLLKRHVFAAPYYKAFNAVGKADPGLIRVDYRSGEPVWFKVQGDSVMVLVAVDFKDRDDVIYGRQFLQEFCRNISGAPSVDTKINGDIPRELVNEGVHAEAFVTFVLQARHYGEKNREATINSLETFRNYLHYHIKCLKANLHIRMRNRVSQMLQVLNRARHELPKEKKTIAGKTFRRAED